MSNDVPPGSGPVPPEQRRFRDRLWSLRAVITVALASVIVGGLCGAALAGLGGHDDRMGPGMGPGRGRFQGGPMVPGSPQWRWGDGPRGYTDPRGRGPWQWYQEGPGGVGPGTPIPPTATPLPPSP